MPKFYVTKVVRIEGNDHIHAKERAENSRGEVVSHVVDNCGEDDTLETFAAMHDLTKFMKAGYLAMTPLDVRDRITQDIEDEGEDSLYAGLDVDELVARTVKTMPWTRFDNENIMNAAWETIDHAISVARKSMHNDK